MFVPIILMAVVISLNPGLASNSICVDASSLET